MTKVKKVVATLAKKKGLWALLIVVFCVAGAATVKAKAETTEYTLEVKDGDDITSALQSAVKKYSKVIIPEGTYICTGVKLNSLEGVTIYAKGATIKMTGSNPALFVSNGAYACDIKIQGGVWDANNLNLPALRFYGTASNIVLSELTVKNSANAGIRFNTSSDVTIEGVTSTDNVGYAVIFESSNNIKVNNSRFLDSKTGIYFKGCTGSIVVSYAECTGNIDRAILAETTPSLTIKNSELNNNAEGIRISGATGEVTLDTNNIKNNEGMGIRIFDCTGKLQLNRNYSYDNVRSGFSIENCTGTIKMYKAYAKRNLDSGFTIKNCPNLTFETCVSSDNENYGYNLDCSIDTSIVMKDTQVTSNGNIGIRAINCKVLNIDGGTVTNNNGSGIYANVVSDNVAIANSEISNNIDGLRISDSAADITVTNNNIKANKEFGVRIFECTGGLTFTTNYLEENGRSGLSLENCCDIVKITSVEAKKNKDSGFSISNCRGITLEACIASENTNYGYNLDCDTQTSVVMKDSKAISNGDIGIRVVNGKILQMVGNLSQNNKGAGVYIGSFSGKILVDKLDVVENEGYGINLNSNTDSSTLSQIASISNADSGYIINMCQNVVISDSRSLYNGAHGVYVLDSVATLNNLEVANSYWCGLSVSGSKTNCTVNGGSYIQNGKRPDRYENDDSLCAGIGIYEGATGTLNEVYSASNHGCGVAIAGADDGSASCKAYIYGCEIVDNNDHGIGARPYGHVDIAKSTSGKNNIIKDNRHHGIMLNDNFTSNTISDCEILNNGKSGISLGVSSKVKSVSGCRILLNKEDGIHLAATSSANIKNCEISENTLCGVGVYSSSKVTISEGCVISGNKTTGVTLDSSTSDYIKDSSISENVQAGVVVRNDSKLIMLSGSKILKNGTRGIYVNTGGELDVDSTYIVGNVAEGIRVVDEYSEATLTNVTFAANGGKAIATAVNGVVNQGSGVVIKDEIPQLKATTKASVTTVLLDGEVVFTTSATGGLGTYTYTISVENKETGKTSELSSGSSNTYTWKAGSIGTRIFYVTVADEVGSVVECEAITVITIDGKLAATTEVSANATEVGDKITFTTTATGGTAPYTYSYVVHNKTTNKWSKLKSNATTNIYTWTAGSVGTRVFYVDVTDASGKTVRCEGLTVTTEGPAELTATAKSNVTTTAVGDKVTFTVTAAGGTAPYTYSYVVHNKTTNKWSKLKTGVTTNTYTWKAGSVGTRVFYVDVTDASGKTVRCKGLTITTEGPVELTATAKSNVTTTAVGDKVTFTVTATGGTAPYTYSYVVYNKTTGKWAKVKSNATTKTYTWKAGSTGTRVFYVDVTDATGKTIRCKGITVTTEGPVELTATTKSNVTATVVGDKVTFTTTATGGTGPYTYSVIVNNQTTGKWSKLRSDSTSNTYTWKAGSAGTRIFYVDVTDASGKTIRCKAVKIITEKAE